MTQTILKVEAFIKLSNTEKVKFTQKTYPCGREVKDEVWEYDFGVFENIVCEDCQKENVTGFGTSDEREPKWCEDCFIKISENTDFIRS